MIRGRSKEFKLRIDRMAIADITEEVMTGAFNPKIAQLIMTGAPKQDVDTAAVILALEKYLTDRRCEPDFEVILD